MSCVHLDAIDFSRLLIVCSVCVMLLSVRVSNIVLGFDFPVSCFVDLCLACILFMAGCVGVYRVACFWMASVFAES